MRNEQMTTKTSGRILVLDDRLNAPHGPSNIVANSDCHVDVVHDTDAALRMLQQRPYDVTLLNLDRCGTYGLPFYRQIKRFWPETVVILVASCAANPTAKIAVAAGAWQIVPKPVDIPQLLSILEQALIVPLIMIVDRDPSLCSQLFNVLRENAQRILATQGHLQGQRRLHRGHYKAVLIDANLSDKQHGMDALEQARKANPTARVMVITGSRTALTEIVRQLISEGVDAVGYVHSDSTHWYDTVEEFRTSSRQKWDLC